MTEKDLRLPVSDRYVRSFCTCFWIAGPWRFSLSCLFGRQHPVSVVIRSLQMEPHPERRWYWLQVDVGFRSGIPDGEVYNSLDADISWGSQFWKTQQ